MCSRPYDSQLFLSDYSAKMQSTVWVLNCIFNKRILKGPDGASFGVKAIPGNFGLLCFLKSFTHPSKEEILALKWKTNLNQFSVGLN